MRSLSVLRFSVLALAIGCGAPGAGPSGPPDTGSGGTSGGLFTDAGAGAVAGGSAGTPGAPGDAAGAAGTGGSTLGAGGASGTGECSGRPAEISEIARGALASGTDVDLEGVVAQSQKFLVARRSSTGSCLWGVFVSAPLAEAAEHSAVLVVGYGLPSESGAGGLRSCRSGTDAIPDDVAVGDVLRIRGKIEPFEPAACAGGIWASQARLRAFQSCPIQKRGTLAPPEPYPIDVPIAERLARGDDAALLRAWAGSLVRLRGVSGAQDGSNPDVVGPYGTIRLNETSLELRDDIYYGDLAAGGPGGVNKAPVFGYPTVFSRVDGLVYLDYCAWVLAPRDKCKDFDPSSADCP